MIWLALLAAACVIWSLPFRLLGWIVSLALYINRQHR